MPLGIYSERRVFLRAALLALLFAQCVFANAAPTLGERKQIFDTSFIEGGPYYVNDHSLIQGPDGRWHLFGIFHREPFAPEMEFDFVHAVSEEREPSRWRHGSFHLAPAPHSIALSADRGLGETHLWAPHVVREGSLFLMFYQSGGPDNHRARMRVAVSSDLYRWTRVGDAPLFEDICVSRDPMVFKHQGQWIMYYTRCDSRENQRSGVAYRTSPDLVHWSAAEMALVLPETPPMFNSGYTESPFVFERDGWFYLSVTSYPIEWTATMLYRSRSPFGFSPQVFARLESHAGEWIFDSSGQAWLSHCGAGQRGVWFSSVNGI